MRLLNSLKISALAALLALGLIGVSQPASAQLTPLASGPYKNLLVCGDFGVCPWQQGTSSVGGNIANTATYTADQWFCWGGSSSSINVSQNTTAANLPPATQAAFQMQRTSANSNTAAISCAQILETANTIPLEGKALSAQFQLSAGANFSGSGGVTVNFVTGTGTNEGSANLASGSWTGQATTSTATIPAALILTSAPTPFFSGATGGPFNGLTFTVPTTAKELAIVFTWTPTGTAGSNDWIALANVQLEASNTPTQFERRTAGQELILAERYFYQINEPANNVVLAGIAGVATASNTQTLLFATPETLFKAGTFSDTAGSLKWTGADSVAVGTLTAGTGTVNGCIATGAATSATAGPLMLTGGGGAGLIACAARL